MKKISDKYILTAYLLLFFGVAVTMALLQPHVDVTALRVSPPDEQYRYLVPQYICRHGILPNGYDPEIRIPSYGFSYGFYNMFPYIIQGYLMRFVSLFTGSEAVLLFTARFVNVLCGTAMAAVVYGIAKRLFEDRRFRWLFCVLVMYLPQNLFIHTYVNTDSMCLLSTALIVYGLVRAYQEGFSVPNCLWLSLGIILCALSYYNAYGYILSSIVLFLAFFLYKKKDDGKWGYHWKEMWKKGGLIAAVVLLGIGWYFIRNMILYDGDLIGLKSRELCATLYAPPETNPLTALTYQAMGMSVGEMLKATDFFSGMFMSFVAAFGSVSIVGSIWFYRFYKAMLIVGILSFIILRGRKEQDSTVRFRKGFFHGNLVFCILMPLILCIYYAYAMDFQNQGRYVLPTVIPVMYYVTAGVEKLAGLGWLPKKGEKIRKPLSVAAKVAVYFAIIAALGIMLGMVFGYALPLYTA